MELYYIPLNVLHYIQYCFKFLGRETNSISIWRWFWDRLALGIWDPLLQCLHLDKCLLEQQNTKTLYVTVCMSSCGKLRTIRYKKTKNPTATSEALGAKQGTANDPYTQLHPGGGQATQAIPLTRSLDAPLPSYHFKDQFTPLPSREPARELVTCSCALLLQRKSQ